MLINLIFNYGSRVITSLSSFLFIPIYIIILGENNFSIIAISTIILSIVFLLELGLTPSISREIAREDTTQEHKYCSIVSAEKIIILFFLILFVISVLVSIIFESHINEKFEFVDQSVPILLLIIILESFFQLLFKFYFSCLLSIENQVKANLLNVTWLLSRNGLVILLIKFIPDLRLFFIYQASITLIFFLFTRFYFFELIKEWSDKKVFYDKNAISKIKKFAYGVFFVSFVATLNTQIDKVFLSVFSSVDDINAYILSFSLGGAILIATTPVIATLQPRLTNAFTAKRYDTANVIVLIMGKIIGYVSLPMCFALLINPNLFVTFWLGEVSFKDEMINILPYIILSYFVIGLSYASFAVNIANGNTLINNLIGAVTLAVSIPVYYVVIINYELLHLAISFMSIQIFMSVILMWLTFKRFCHFNIFYFFIKSLLKPLLCTTILYFLIYLPMSNINLGAELQTFIWLLTAYLFLSVLYCFEHKKKSAELVYK